MCAESSLLCYSRYDIWCLFVSIARTWWSWIGSSISHTIRLLMYGHWKNSSITYYQNTSKSGHISSKMESPDNNPVRSQDLDFKDRNSYQFSTIGWWRVPVLVLIMCQVIIFTEQGLKITNISNKTGLNISKLPKGFKQAQARSCLDQNFPSFPQLSWRIKKAHSVIFIQSQI